MLFEPRIHDDALIELRILVNHSNCYRCSFTPLLFGGIGISVTDAHPLRFFHSSLPDFEEVLDEGGPPSATLRPTEPLMPLERIDNRVEDENEG
ncbi:unnamed protein product [Cylicostephanus goldi]|uniref:Uncharacterized protein n=1 Tax=Cylicostephanus goldi TaxID=71465 RepID=A0A3P7PX26_CYLGO|nr:unnamed protein product [Cylicostephanus goldi]